MNVSPFDLLKNAQKLQAGFGAFQEKLESITVTGQAGGGMVEIDLNGKMDMLAVRITPELLSAGDVEMLQDLVISAYISASEKVRDAVTSGAAEMSGGIDLNSLASMFGQH
jgi:DNA-binding YbaB/EbfC family protein